jgi:hypothetical protein
VSADDDGTGPRPTEPVAPDADAAADEPMPPAARWLARLAVVALALKFISDGFRDQWAPARGLGTALLYTAIVLGVCSAGVALMHVTRRGR